MGCQGTQRWQKECKRAFFKKGGITYSGIVTAAPQNPTRSKINLKPELLSSHTPCPWIILWLAKSSVRGWHVGGSHGFGGALCRLLRQWGIQESSNARCLLAAFGSSLFSAYGLCWPISLSMTSTHYPGKIPQADTRLDSASSLCEELCRRSRARSRWQVLCRSCMKLLCKIPL